MKRNVTLFLVMLCSYLGFGAAPTVPASNATYTSIDGTQFTCWFTTGNGSIRIAVVKEGSPVAGKPVDGVDYTPNAAFGSAGSLFTAPGEYVVAKTSSSYFTVNNLLPGKTYYIAIFEYNGTGVTTQYLMLPLATSQATVIAPTVQVSDISATAVAGNSFTLNFTKGNGSGRIIIARKGAPVNAVPADITNYNGDINFGNGTRIGSDNFVVYKGTGITTQVKNLEPNTNYYFAAFEYNGNLSPMYLTPGAVFSLTTNMGPTIASSSINFGTIEGAKLTINLSPGNGNRRLFVMKKGSAVTAVPVNGTLYPANAVFGTAGSEIVPGEFVVGATAASSIVVTNLEPNTTYHVRVYEYDVDNAANTWYLTTAYAVKSGSTAITPTLIASNLSVLSFSGTNATIGFTPGGGSYRMVIMKAGSPVSVAPTDLIQYPGNSTMGSGTNMGSGNYSIAWGMSGSSNQFYVSNLQAGITYHAAVYEINGVEFPVYSKTGGTISFTMPLEPTVIAKSPSTVFVEGKSFRFVWTNGNGARRIVVARKGSAVTAKPVDNLSYTANENFGQGQALSADEFVVYDGNSNYFDFKNLEIGTTYHFAVFEYNLGQDGKPDYLTSSWLAFNTATVSAPSTQLAITGIASLTSSQVTVNFNRGTGNSRIFIMKQGTPVNVEPQDITKYTYNGAFGTISSHISDGNYVVSNTNSTGNFIVTNLQPNTTYHISGFEYNGNTEPVYLRTSPSVINFTTPDVPGATTPTIPASAAVISNTEGDRLNLKWTVGNGEKRIVVMRQGSPVTFIPTAGVSYTANAAMGTGTDMGGGQYIIFNSSFDRVDVTALQPATTYYYAVYEYNGTGTLIRYLTSASLTGNAGTLQAPVTSSGGVLETTGAQDITLNWTKGSGTGRLVIFKEGSAVTGAPTNLSVYPSNSVFKNGAQVAINEFVVYAGTGSTVKVTGLTPNTTYYYSIVEYNGNIAPVYNTSVATTGSAATSSPLPVKLLYFKGTVSVPGVLLTWATAQELNSASFTVERSDDGVNFQPIATIAAAGNSNSTKTYNYRDVTAGNGKIYYRLLQTDVDGQFTRSGIQVVIFDTKAGEISIAPNPVVDQFKITLPTGVNNGVLRIFDAGGILVKLQNITSGQYVNCSAMKPGTYYVSVVAAGEVYRLPLVKR